MKKVWIDLTDISVWNGHHTGTQRVVYQLAKRYHGTEGVGYFVFNPKTNTFHEHSFDEVVDRVEAIEEPPAPSEVRVPLRAHLRHLANRAYVHSPAPIKKRLTAARRQALKNAYKKAKRLLRPAKPVVVVPTTPAIHFGKDDTLLIMGKPWDYPSLIETLRKEKLEHGFKLIQVVYDLIPVFFPHLFGLPLFEPYTQHMFETAAISDGLLAISESSKRDMQKFCDEMLIPAPPIEVIRLGDDFAKVEASKPNLTGLDEKNFILCVGTVEVRKNHQLLYMAYKEGLRQGHKLPDLVIVGGGGWYSGDVLYQLAYDPEIKDHVRVLSHINDRELDWLYSNCKFTVYPSVYEGWGLPIAESLARGKVCVASNAASMTEIAGDLIDYFSPYNSQECMEAIVKYTDQKVLDDKEQDIAHNYKPYTWDGTYNEVAQFVSKF